MVGREQVASFHMAIGTMQLLCGRWYFGDSSHHTVVPLTQPKSKCSSNVTIYTHQAMVTAAWKQAHDVGRSSVTA